MCRWRGGKREQVGQREKEEKGRQKEGDILR